MDAIRRETTHNNIVPLVIENHIVFNQILKVFNVHWGPTRKTNLSGSGTLGKLKLEWNMQHSHLKTSKTGLAD